LAEKVRLVADKRADAGRRSPDQQPGFATGDRRLRRASVRTIAERYRRAGRFGTQYRAPELHVGGRRLAPIYCRRGRGSPAGEGIRPDRARRQRRADAVVKPPLTMARRLGRICCLRLHPSAPI
jgi:hypothetical protein